MLLHIKYGTMIPSECKFVFFRIPNPVIHNMYLVKSSFLRKKHTIC